MPPLNGNGSESHKHQEQTPLAIRDFKNEIGSVGLLHSPSLSQDTGLPAEATRERPPSPSEILYHTPHHSNSDQVDVAKGEYFPGQKKDDKSKYKWVLTPRRDHAALNSGTKSIAEKNKVVLIAWPVEVHDVEGAKIGAGTLTPQERQELEDGFKKLADPNDKAGITCVPVWMSDEVSCDSLLAMFCLALGTSAHHYRLSSIRSPTRCISTTAKPIYGPPSTILACQIIRRKRSKTKPGVHTMPRILRMQTKSPRSTERVTW